MVSQVIVISIGILAVSVTAKVVLASNGTEMTESKVTTSMNETSTAGSSANETFKNQFLTLIFQSVTTIYVFFNDYVFFNKKEWLNNRCGEFVQK